MQGVSVHEPTKLADATHVKVACLRTLPGIQLSCPHKLWRSVSLMTLWVGNLIRLARPLLPLIFIEVLSTPMYATAPPGCLLHHFTLLSTDEVVTAGRVNCLTNSVLVLFLTAQRFSPTCFLLALSHLGLYIMPRLKQPDRSG